MLDRANYYTLVMKNKEKVNPYDNFAFYYEERTLKDGETKKKKGKIM
ncbi:MAG: hypothetical protein KAS63_04225 [Candidatus Heimdallarchaeota archaeon]|nr:hypothetical protein [Candidatus Heimdallarchaeota archaeon]MCK4954542.1 hypothetical protein [Candidatus Heimdallarchaeota archaeon]